jgi:acyl-CoA thioesterase-1
MRNECELGRAWANRHAGLLRRGTLAICAVVWVILADFPREAAAAPDSTVILVLGDSFTAGLGVPPKAAFWAQLEARLRARGEAARVVNAGVSGDTTAGGLARVDRALAEKPDLVILELGANDALRGIQPAVVRANLDALITKIQADNARLLLTGMRAPPNWGEDYRIAFDRIYPDLARIRGVPLYPFFLQGVQGGVRDTELNQPDRLHPNERGVRVLVDHIAPVVEYLIRRQGTGQIPVATDEGIISMNEREYRDYTREMGSLPVLSKSYIFGSSIPMPSIDDQGHVRVPDRNEATTGPGR